MNIEIADSDTGFIYSTMALMDIDTVREILKTANYCIEHVGGTDEEDEEALNSLLELASQCESILEHVE